MAEPLKKTTSLYDTDFYAWTQEQAAKLRARAHNGIDWENAAEEIESLGRNDQRAVRSRLNVLVMHLLKWRYQPGKRKPGWRSTIIEQRRQIAGLVGESPSLRRLPAESLADEYQYARIKAADETGLPENMFPLDCPFTIDQILEKSFYPEAD